MGRTVTSLIALALGLAGGCSQPVSAPAPSAAEAVAPVLSPDERLFGVERFTIAYDQTGHDQGAVVEHVRDWGRARAEIKDTTLSIGGISHRSRIRVVHARAEIASVNVVSGDVTLATDPDYDDLVAAEGAREAVAVGAAIMTRMGGRQTADTATFAGHECAYWELPQLGSRACVTPWGATLHNTAALGGLRVERVATAVRIGDGGPDDAFTYDDARAMRAPEIHAPARGGDQAD
jgi:hypothetical protein